MPNYRVSGMFRGGKADDIKRSSTARLEAAGMTADRRWLTAAVSGAIRLTPYGGHRAAGARVEDR